MDIGAAWGVADGSSLPAGFLLNQGTGEISGTPSESGKFTCFVIAECADLTASKEFRITVLPEGVTLEAGNKIFLWENLEMIRPLYNAFTVNK